MHPAEGGEEEDTGRTIFFSTKVEMEKERNNSRHDSTKQISLLFRRLLLLFHSISLFPFFSFTSEEKKGKEGRTERRKRRRNGAPGISSSLQKRGLLFVGEEEVLFFFWQGHLLFREKTREKKAQKDGMG